ncbi:four-helix bundle copper-binding protein [Isosphaeraceae bacterium EP7]
MIRREMLGTLGAGVGLMALGANANAAAPDDKHEHHMHDKVHADCLKACGECAVSCNETYHHCGGMVASGKADHYKSMILLGDCATFCAHSACLISKHSPLMAHSCAACAEACKDTIAEVAKFDSSEMKEAVTALKACESSCRAMVAAMKSGHPHHADSKAG